MSSIRLDKPWPGVAAITQGFGVTTYAGEPPGYVWPDKSVSYFTPGGTHYAHVHSGLDIGLTFGTPLSAPADGVVMMASEDSTGYGHCIRILHAALGITTLYGHLSEYGVKVGQSVKRGQFIGRVGSTGNSNGPHLHLSVIRSSDTRYVDPAPFLAVAPPRPPRPADLYHTVSFTVTANSDGHLVRFYAGPSDETEQRGIAMPGAKIACVGYMLGNAKFDPTAPNGGQWDRRWYLCEQGWLSSSRVQGNAPGSTP